MNESEIYVADRAPRTHVREIEDRAYNQMPKAGWRDLRLMRFDGTDLYQWFGKRGKETAAKDWSIFEDGATEVFQLRPLSRALQHTPEPVAWPSREVVAKVLEVLDENYVGVINGVLTWGAGHASQGWPLNRDERAEILALFQPLAALSLGGEAEVSARTQTNDGS